MVVKAAQPQVVVPRDGPPWPPTKGTVARPSSIIQSMASIRRPPLAHAVALGAATVGVGILGLFALAGWTAGGVLTLDGVPITVHSVDCGRVGFGMPGMSIDVTYGGWRGTISVAEDTHPYAPNTLADPAVPTYSITWDVYRSMTWTNEGDVTYSHGYLSTQP